jgi:hypothetical protein
MNETLQYHHNQEMKYGTGSPSLIPLLIELVS